MNTRQTLSQTPVTEQTKRNNEKPQKP